MSARLFALLLLPVALVALARAEPLLFVEAELVPPTPYVQQAATYTLRFFQGSDARDIVIEAPQARLADIRPLGTPTIRELERNGRRYRVHQRQFAVTPFASGKLALIPGQVRARLPGKAGTQRWSPPRQDIQVLEIPAHVDPAHWLPAESVVLHETWLPTTESGPIPVAPGQTLQRRITIEARGVAAEQIPPLAVRIADATILAHPARLETRSASGQLVGTREQVFDITPTQPGELTLPPLELTFWKVGAGATVHAGLPARTLRVTGATPATAGTKGSGGSGLNWVLPGIAFIASLALLLGRRTLWLAWRIWRASDAHALRAVLLAWAARRWPDDPPRTLVALAARVRTPALAQALHALDCQLYGQPLAPFVAGEIRQALLRELLEPARPAGFMAAHDARRQAAPS